MVTERPGKVRFNDLVHVVALWHEHETQWFRTPCSYSSGWYRIGGFDGVARADGAVVTCIGCARVQ